MRRFFFKETLLFLVIAFAIFWPVVLYHFAFHNDLGFWMYGQPGKDHSTFWETGHLVIFGRPLGAILLNLHAYALRNFTGIGTLSASRFIAVLTWASLAGAFCSYLRAHTRLSVGSVRLLAILTWVQPQWLTAIIWISTFVPVLVGTALALGAAYWFEQSLKTRSPRLALLSFAVLSGCVLVYPVSATLFFWIPLLGLMIQAPPSKKETLVWLLFFGIATIFALANQKLWIEYIMCHNRFINCVTWAHDTAAVSQYSLAPAVSFIPKLRAIAELFALTWMGWLSFFGPLPHGSTALAALCALIMLAPIWFRTKRPEGIVLLLALFLPQLVTKGQVIMFRTAIPLTLVFGLSVIHWIGMMQNPFKKLVTLGLPLILCALAAYHTQKFASKYQAEWQALVESPELPGLCKMRHGTDILIKFEGVVMPKLAPATLETNYDFGNSVFVPWVISGVCKLMDYPGSPYFGSLPGP